MSEKEKAFDEWFKKRHSGIDQPLYEEIRGDLLSKQVWSDAWDACSELFQPQLKRLELFRQLTPQPYQDRINAHLQQNDLINECKEFITIPEKCSWCGNIDLLRSKKETHFLICEKCAIEDISQNPGDR